MKDKIKTCSRCVLDASIPNICFNEEGKCNYCISYDKIAMQYLYKDGSGQFELQKLVAKIKEDGKNKKYDCLIGLSGGVDSSYVAYIVSKMGLRPLAFHLDNGWNSDTSVRNIKNIVSKLKIDFFTYVIDWEEFKDLQLSFLKAGVIDIELLTDHAITAVAYQLIRKEKIKYFISGSNYATEAIMPEGWSYYKWDSKNILAIHKKFGKVPIKTFPHYGLIEKIKSQSVYQVVRILDFVEYRKEDAMEILKSELGWEYYGGKHYESVFTKFYQAYILPQKFKVDKRKAHLSTLICSGQITRKEALKELEKPLYGSNQELEKDIEYAIKKFGLTRQEFDKILNAPPKSHLEYPNGVFTNDLFKKVKQIVSA